MHRCSVALLDLRPDNILVNVASRAVLIPDFDVSILVRDEDEVTQGYTGTPGWTAPEIGDEYDPPKKYSPIRADRWACGQMIQYFRTFDPGFQDSALERLSSQLLDEDPVKRPCLLGQPLQIKKRPVANIAGPVDQQPSNAETAWKKKRLGG